MRRKTDINIQIYSIVKSLTFRKVIALFLIICFSMQFISTGSFDADNNGEDNDTNMKQKSEISRSLSSMKGWFTENKGQIGNSDVEYAYLASDVSIGFIESGYLITMSNTDNLTNLVKITFEGANRVMPEGKGELPHKSNFFRGNDSSNWNHGVRNFDTVVYQNLYDGINLIFYTAENGLKYDFVVSPGANPDEICMEYEGVDDLDISSQGNLHISILSKVLIEEAPYSYQTKNCERIMINSSYQVSGNKVNFTIEKFDPTIPLTIDPLIYSTFIGGNSSDWGADIVLDSENNVYIIGATGSPNFPTTSDGYDTEYNDDSDVVVFKLDSRGSSLLYSTYIGGNDTDSGGAITIDDKGNAYVTGYTYSQDFPTNSEAYDTTQNGYEDLFAIKLNPDGSDLLYSTYIGGSDTDYGRAITIDFEGNAYVTGETWSEDFPTTVGAFDNSYNGWGDTFVVKLNEVGSSITFSTLMGGYDVEEGWAIEVDDDLNIFVAGYSSSPDCPTTIGAYDNTHNGKPDVLIFKLNSEGSSLIYSTFVGAPGQDVAYDMRIDDNGCAYVSGHTRSVNFPTTIGSHDNTYNGGFADAFALKLNSEGTDLVFSTFIGGSEWDESIGLAINSNGDMIITGWTNSTDFPITSNAYDTSHNGENDVFLLQLNSDGSSLRYSTFIGGSADEVGTSIVLTTESNMFVTGWVYSSDFPITRETYDSSYNGNGDIFVFQLSLTIQDTSQISDGSEGQKNILDEPQFLAIIVALIIVLAIIVSFAIMDMRNKEDL